MSTKNFLLIDKTDHLCDNGIMKKKSQVINIKSDWKRITVDKIAYDYIVEKKEGI